MSFQVGIGSLSGSVFFQLGLCTPLRTMKMICENSKRYGRVPTMLKGATLEKYENLAHLDALKIHFQRSLLALNEVNIK